MTDKTGGPALWEAHGGMLVYGSGTPEACTVASLWHDERRDYIGKDGRAESGTFASNRECLPWKDSDEWKRKCALLDQIVEALNAARTADPDERKG